MPDCTSAHLSRCWRRGFVRHFFQCSECAEHFTAMATAPDALAVQSQREAVLWIWQAHNQVGACAP